MNKKPSRELRSLFSANNLYDEHGIPEISTMVDYAQIDAML